MWPLIYYPRLLTWRKTLSTWESIWPLTSLSWPHDLFLTASNLTPYLFSQNIQNFCHSSHDDSHTSFRMTYLTSPSRLLRVYIYDIWLTVIGDLWSFAHDLLHDPSSAPYDLRHGVLYDLPELRGWRWRNSTSHCHPDSSESIVDYLQNTIKKVACSIPYTYNKFFCLLSICKLLVIITF